MAAAKVGHAGIALYIRTQKQRGPIQPPLFLFLVRQPCTRLQHLTQLVRELPLHYLRPILQRLGQVAHGNRIPA